MQCICGYAHYQDYQIDNMTKEGTEFTQGSSEFLQMTAIQAFDKRYPSYYSSSVDTYTVYACPKCGTLKINI